jgi:hypothetical protein
MRRVLSFDVGTRSLGYAVVAAVPGAGGAETCTVERWATVDLLAGEVKPNLQTVTERMLEFLSGLDVSGVTDVVLEAQRGGKFGNMTMVTVSYVMFAFYKTRSLTVPGAPAPRFQSPVLKVSAAKRLLPDAVVAAKTRAAAPDETQRQSNARHYTSNKDLSRAAACELLRVHPGMASQPMHLAYHSACKKQREDLSDCLMQAHAFLFPAAAAPPKRRRVVEQGAASATLEPALAALEQAPAKKRRLKKNAS